MAVRKVVAGRTYSQTRGDATSIQVFGEPTAAIEEMLRHQAAERCWVEISSRSLGVFTR